MPEKSTRPWWDEVSIQTGGDVIIGEVGAGAQNVAIGKNITQAVYEVLGDPTPDDRKLIESSFADLTAAISGLSSQLDAGVAGSVEFQIELLQGELAKTEEDEQPSATTITKVGDWLLNNIPDIAEVLAGVFATPAVGRVVGKAGKVAVDWVKDRFGAAS